MPLAAGRHKLCKAVAPQFCMSVPSLYYCARGSVFPSSVILREGLSLPPVILSRA